MLAEVGKPTEAGDPLERAARLADADNVPEDIAAEVDAEFEGLALTAEAGM